MYDFMRMVKEPRFSPSVCFRCVLLEFFPSRQKNVGFPGKYMVHLLLQKIYNLLSHIPLRCC